LNRVLSGTSIQQAASAIARISRARAQTTSMRQDPPDAMHQGPLRSAMREQRQCHTPPVYVSMRIYSENARRSNPAAPHMLSLKSLKPHQSAVANQSTAPDPRSSPQARRTLSYARSSVVQQGARDWPVLWPVLPSVQEARRGEARQRVHGNTLRDDLAGAQCR